MYLKEARNSNVLHSYSTDYRSYTLIAKLQLKIQCLPCIESNMDGVQKGDSAKISTAVIICSSAACIRLLLILLIQKRWFLNARSTYGDKSMTNAKNGPKIVLIAQLTKSRSASSEVLLVVEMALAEGRVSTTASARSVMKDEMQPRAGTRAPIHNSKFTSQLLVFHINVFECLSVFTDKTAISIDITTGQS